MACSNLNLLDKEKHKHCIFNNSSNPFPLMRIVERGKDYIAECDIKEPEIVFVISGEIQVKANDSRISNISGGNFIFLPPGRGISIKYTNDSLLLIMRIELSEQICFQQTLKELEYKEDNEQDGFHSLPINKFVSTFLEGVFPFIEDGLLCHKFLQAQITAFHHILTGYFNKDQLSAFYNKMLTKDVYFMLMFLAKVGTVKSVKDMQDALGMGATKLLNRCKQTFGRTPAELLWREKKNKIKNAIQFTNKPFSDIMVEYEITNFTLFCKRHFDMTPSQLRALR